MTRAATNTGTPLPAREYLKKQIDPAELTAAVLHFTALEP